MHRIRNAYLIAGLLAGIVLCSRPVDAQYSTDYQTNLISNATSNWSGGYLIGSNTFADALLIQNSGVLSNGTGYLGYAISSSNNTACVTDAGSLWATHTNLFIGYSGAGNALIITNSGHVVNGSVFFGSAFIGYNSSSSSNVVLVSGAGSTWSNTSALYVGYNGPDNHLTITKGGQVFSTIPPPGGPSGVVGYDSNSSNNRVLISDTNSVWKNVGSLYVGSSGASNSLVISNGGKVIDSSSTIGNSSSSSNNSVLVTDAGSVWSNANTLVIGLQSSGHSLVISNGGQVVNGNGGLGTGFGVGGSRSNTVVVTGSGSVWKNNGTLNMSGKGSANRLIINDGGQVRSAYGIVGALDSPNSVLVTNGGMWQCDTLTIGDLGSSNSVVIVDGILSATNILVGATSQACDNFLQLDSGSLIVTNASSDAMLEVRYGKLILNGGTLRVDRFVMTNACAQFVRTGGTLIYGTAVLDPNLDADGDGIPNGWEQSHGLDPLNAADANADSDGDGFTNLQEYLAGTDPTNNASSFKITSIAQEGNGLRVTWLTGIGRTNALQATAGNASGGYSTNSFADVFTVTNTVGSLTNYLDPGAATNFPSRFYRVHLVP